MTLRSFITTPQASHKDAPFPKLVIYDGIDSPKFIVFAVSIEDEHIMGFVVWSEEQGEHKIARRFLGEHGEWLAKAFSDWYGTIAFQQDLELVVTSKD